MSLGSRMTRPVTAGRVLGFAARGAASIERAAARTIDREAEEESAARYWHMIGADLSLEERRERALADNPVRPRVAS